MLLFSALAMPVISPEFDFAFLARVWARGSGQTLPIVLDRKKTATLRIHARFGTGSLSVKWCIHCIALDKVILHWRLN